MRAVRWLEARRCCLIARSFGSSMEPPARCHGGNRAEEREPLQRVLGSLEDRWV